MTISVDGCEIGYDVTGSADDRTLPEAGRELSQKLGNASFGELAEVGHTMPLEAPDAVGASIVEFLAERT